jgi:mono/diheme cytochrome c family protein
MGDEGEAKGDGDGDVKPEGEAKAEGEPKAPRKPRPKPTTADGGDAPKKPAPKKPAAPKADAANGRQLFAAKCKTCHGSDGKGDTPFGQKLGVPSLSKSPLSRKAVHAKIANGVPGTKMKAYKDSLSPQELDDLTAFVKRL